jgi:hypothetical protein
MSFLTYARDERMVVVGITAAFVGVVATMRVLLQQWRDGTEIKPQQPTTQYITQETEDSLKPSTLEMLLGHYNFAIREVAAKIVCDRAVNDGETIDYLLWGITRPDYDERMKNLRTLAFITDPRMNHHSWSTGKWRKGMCAALPSRSSIWRASAWTECLHTSGTYSVTTALTNFSQY